MLQPFVLIPMVRLMELQCSSGEGRQATVGGPVKGLVAAELGKTVVGMEVEKDEKSVENMTNCLLSLNLQCSLTI